LKILVVSNLYPPYYLGGYELGCSNVVDRLIERGHQLQVLTSTYGVGHSQSEGHVHRQLDFSLQWPSGVRRFPKLVKREWNNQSAIRGLIGHFKPDLIYLWNLQFGCLSLAFASEATGLPVVYFVSDHWLARFQQMDPLYSLLNTPATTAVGRIARPLLRSALRMGHCTIPSGTLRPDCVQFCSEHLRREAIAAIGEVPANVIHWGVDRELFYTQRTNRKPTRVLFCGQLIPSKGIQTAVEAFIEIAGQPGGELLTLTIAGAANDDRFERTLQQRITNSAVASRISLVGKLTREELRNVYRDHDAFLFPSEWDEPFSISLVEAMASGLCVIGTQTGGTPEILRDGETGFVFHAGDVADCGRALKTLVIDPEKCQSLAANGQRLAMQQFELTQMIDKIESSLEATIAVNARTTVKKTPSE
jgi:glycosyltransferase involved in cell wall biosynthesis